MPGAGPPCRRRAEGVGGVGRPVLSRWGGVVAAPARGAPGARGGPRHGPGTGRGSRCSPEGGDARPLGCGSQGGAGRDPLRGPSIPAPPSATCGRGGGGGGGFGHRHSPVSVAGALAGGGGVLRPAPGWGSFSELHRGLIPGAYTGGSVSRSGAGLGCGAAARAQRPCHRRCHRSRWDPAPAGPGCGCAAGWTGPGGTCAL